MKDRYSISCNLRETAFYIYFAIMLTCKGIGLYEGMPVYNLCLVASTGVLFLKLLLDDYNLKEMTGMAVLALLGLFVWRNSGEKGPFLYILLIIGMKGIPVKRVFRLGCFIWSSAFVIQVLLALAGIRQGVFMAHDKLGLGHIIRWGLGYPHPNVLHISYGILIAFVLYVLQLEGRRLVTATVLCFAGNLYIFLYSVSYTGFVFTTAYLLVNLYLGLRKERTKAEDVLIQMAFPACVLFSVAGPLVFPEKLFRICDKVLNNRFYLSNLYMSEGNWSLFGDRQQELKAFGHTSTLDCSYTYLLMHGGIVIFVLMCAGYMLLIHKYVKEKKNKELAIIIGLMIAGISEPFMFNTAYKNLGLIFMGNSLFEALRKSWKTGTAGNIGIEEKNEKTEWRLSLLSSAGEKQFTVSYGKLGKFGSCMGEWAGRNGKRLCMVGAVAALVFGTGYAVMADVPDSIYILKAGSDKYDEVVYLDIHNLPEGFHSRIVSYVDEKTPMYEFSGNIVKMEYVRGIISSGLAGGVSAAGIYWVICCMRDRKKERIAFHEK